MASEEVVVFDAGGCTIKCGLLSRPDDIRVVPNCVARVKGERAAFVADALLAQSDVSGLSVRRPVDRGQVVNWDLEREIWQRVLSHVLKVHPRNCHLILSEPYFQLPALRAAACVTALLEMEFRSLAMAPPALLSLRRHARMRPEMPANAAGCGLVVDAGFSATHAVPLFAFAVLWEGVRRIDLGGKALSNQFKDLISFRSVNLRDEPYLVEAIKDRTAFVSLNVVADLATAKSKASPHLLSYVLPAGTGDSAGRVLSPEEARSLGAEATVLQLNNERFMVPELLFHPSDIGLDQAGLAETITVAIQACPPPMHRLLYSNILLTGGSACCPNFRERLAMELRPLVPDDYEVGVVLATDPIGDSCRGAVDSAPELLSRRVTAAQFRELGLEACAAWDV